MKIFDYRGISWIDRPEPGALPTSLWIERTPKPIFVQSLVLTFAGFWDILILERYNDYN